jgi:hypothetical protein
MRVCALLLGLMLGCTLPVFSAPVTFALQDYLGEAWRGERVSFPVTLPASAPVDRLVVKEAGGATAPAQFSPDAPKSRTGRLTFVVDLPAQAAQTWTLGSTAKPAATDLFVTPEGESVVFGTSKLAVRCPAGDHVWPEGVDAAAVPAPVLGVRLSDGAWACGGRWASPRKVTRVSGAVTQQGPVFVQYRLTYDFAGGGQYAVTLEAIAGQETITVRESSTLEAKANYFEGVRPAGTPDGNYIMYGFGNKLRTQGTYWTLDLETGLAPDRIAWQPTGNTWGSTPAAGEPWGTFPRVTATGPLVTLNPSHGEWWLNASQWAGVYARDGKPFLALLALHAGAWQAPHENAIVLENSPDGRLRAVLPANTGSRCWALFSAQKDEATAIPGEEPAGEEFPGRQYARPAQLATIKYGLLPLDLVKDWTFRFADPPGTVFPHVVATAAELPAIRARIAATPVLQGEVNKLRGPWESYVREKDPNYPLYKMRRIYPRGLDNLYLATGDEAYGAALTALLLDRLHYYVHQTKAGVGITGYRWSHGYGMFHLTTGALQSFLREADLVLGSPSATPAQKVEVRALMAFWGELFASADYAPPGYNHGNTDMWASYCTTLGAIGCLLNGHPRAKAWASMAEKGIDEALTARDHLPGATQDEWYGELTLDMCVKTAVMLKAAGFRDFFADPRLRDGLDFYGQLLTPVDPRYGAGYVVPFGNGQAHWNRSAVWAIAASAVQKDDPAFAGRLMWYWERAGKPGTLKFGDRDDFGWSSMGWIDTTIPVNNPHYASRLLPDWGVLFRAGCGTPDETFLALQLGKPAGLNGYNAEGGFHWFAYGQPLSLVFGIRSYDASQHKGSTNVVRQRWMANRPSFDYRHETQGGTGTVVEWAPSSGADLASGAWTFSRLTAIVNPYPREGDDRLVLSKPRPEVAGLQPNSPGVAETVAPITWRRHVLFVKSSDPAGVHYFVVRDAAQGKVPWDWSIWCLASAMQPQGSGAAFTGKFGVDLAVTPLTATPEVVTGAYGPTKSFAGDWRQLLYQVQFPQSADFAAVLMPGKHGMPMPVVTPWAGGAGAQVTFPDEMQYVLLADVPTTVKADGITIDGRAAVVRVRAHGAAVSLLSGTKAGCPALTVTATEGPGAVTVSYDAEKKTLTGDTHGPARILRLDVADAPAFTTVTIDGKAVTPEEVGKGVARFTVPAGEHGVVVR